MSFSLDTEGPRTCISDEHNEAHEGCHSNGSGVLQKAATQSTYRGNSSYSDMIKDSDKKYQAFKKSYACDKGESASGPGQRILPWLRAHSIMGRIPWEAYKPRWEKARSTIDPWLIFEKAEREGEGGETLLARTTSSPPTYALLCGNAAHQQALYHPSPSPLEPNKESLSSSEVSHHAKTYCEEQDTCAAPSSFDPSSSEAATERAIADDKAFCMHGFPDKAMRTLAALSRSKACADVMVVL
ncbi:uncharacterized protein UDID_17821 [Ustilago sp. UG-2017a]|nr:uncharacterized protein UDID_17821 [Ustilago sp. UG-2017a]